MSHPLIDLAEKPYLKPRAPEFHTGDVVDVSCKIVEGDKERVQVFNGVVIARRGQGINETFTVRRIVNNEGVERIFMVHSPRVLGITVKRRGKTRRAKLYYLRSRAGKARKLREKRISRPKRAQDAPSANRPPANGADPSAAAPVPAGQTA